MFDCMFVAILCWFAVSTSKLFDAETKFRFAKGLKSDQRLGSFNQKSRLRLNQKFPAKRARGIHVDVLKTRSASEVSALGQKLNQYRTPKTPSKIMRLRTETAQDLTHEPPSLLPPLQLHYNLPPLQLDYNLDNLSRKHWSYHHIAWHPQLQGIAARKRDQYSQTVACSGMFPEFPVLYKFKERWMVTMKQEPLNIKDFAETYMALKRSPITYLLTAHPGMRAYVGCEMFHDGPFGRVFCIYSFEP